MKNKIKIYNRPIYTYWKHHKCIKCGNKLLVGEKVKIINPCSEEFKEYARWFDGYPIGDVEVKDIIFACRRCDFEVKEMTFYNIEKIISRMERMDDEYGVNAQIKYLYEDSIPYAFGEKWRCIKCKAKLKLKYDVIELPRPYHPTFDSYRRHKNSGDTIQLRKLYYSCENCCTKIYMDAVEEGVTVNKRTKH